jgi:multidrug resistance efflux pump
MPRSTATERFPDEATDRPSAPSGRQEGPYDIQGLRRVLEDRINEPPPAPSPEVVEQPERAPADKRSRLGRRIAKTAVGLAIAVAFGWFPLQALLQTSSVEAVLNARVVTLRSPIDGEVTTATAPLTTTGLVENGATVLRVVNPRADRARLDELRRQLARRESERPGIAAKLAAAKIAQQDLARQANHFREGRVLQLEARAAELQSLIEAAIARREEATAAVERATALVRTHIVSAAEFARLTRERTIAVQTEVGARRRLEATEVELKAVREGVFLGDTYNDRPSSVQREEEMRQLAATLEADLVTADYEIAWLHGEVLHELLRHSNLSSAPIKLPVTGRIWEVLTWPGEDVRAGQPLLRVLDCTGAVVTANVTERVYNRLQLGGKATFRLSDGRPDMEGVITNLTGASGAPANLAINPDALSKEAYRVTVSIPGFAAKVADCEVGRTGRVIFNGARTDAP